MTDLCDHQRFTVYEFSPNDMQRGCESIMNDWEVEIERALMRRKNNEDVENEFCYKTTQACEGIDLTAMPRQTDHIEVGGKKIPMRPDGKIEIPSYDELHKDELQQKTKRTNGVNNYI
eukprot:TRINITY_DN11073_c0_g1_i1.p1 TRINITY_DN11073_c0_g1~~TRINITY_DN11073_c0_g1_i1.p1  ORF type:complete len:118 (+),score=28.16 TRINITY_DN11073_c0_g1_i1:249-602(+)